MSSFLRWARTKLHSSFDSRIDEHAFEAQSVSVLLPTFFLVEMLAVIIAAAVFYANDSTTTTMIGPYDPQPLVTPTALQAINLTSSAHGFRAKTILMQSCW